MAEQALTAKESDIVISVKDVAMEFNMSNLKVDSIKEYFVRLVKHELFFKSFYALKGVSFDVRRGEVLGLIGFNGGGKSTMLKIIAGILKPTRGSVEVKGTLSPMIELGAGFDPDLTARENIFLNGSILGYSKEFMQEVFEEVVEFSELHDFLDTPVKNFSSGMQARLGFSVATVVRPEILIVDEVLAVGDYKFQEKCKNRIRELMADNATVILVSHDSNQIEEMCTRAIWIDHGLIKEDGDTMAVCEHYKNA
ncbi:MAG: ABC transporter ATP-binding protein [Oscillospiraceae bacterium]|nr:ABC transporter ATP-binding protein [Oscillospiraceae bacterium]